MDHHANRSSSSRFPNIWSKIKLYFQTFNKLALNINFYNTLTSQSFSMMTLMSPSLILIYITMIIIIGVLAGIYPAFLMSAFKPVSILPKIEKQLIPVAKKYLSTHASVKLSNKPKKNTCFLCITTAHPLYQFRTLLFISLILNEWNSTL